MEILHTILESNVLNFIIVFAIICALVRKIKIDEKLENVKNTIKCYVDDSSDEKNNAEKELVLIKEKVSNLPKEIDKIKISAQNSVESIGKKIEAEIKEQMADIDNNAERIMNLETKKFKSKLTGILSETSINLAKDNALKQLENNRELHNQYINDAINEIDGISL